MDMVGPVSLIAEHGTALVCAECHRPVDARKGRWIHRYPDRRPDFSGFHVPQIIMPMHYSDEDMWISFLQKREKTDKATFLNECMGESCDSGQKLITMTELRRASILHKLDWNEARTSGFEKKYIQRVLGIDWGGGGIDEISFTTLTVIGLTPNGQYQVIWGERLHGATSDADEIVRIKETFSMFQCSYIAHDYGGSGAVKETLLLQAGFPTNRVMPCLYTPGSRRNMITHKPPSQDSSRSYYAVDKPRSLVLMCTLVKTNRLLLPEYDSAKDLTEDLLHLVEAKTETIAAGDIYRIVRQPKMTDDFAHSTNFALCCLYHTRNEFPNIADDMKLTLTEEQISIANPLHQVDFT